MTLLMEAGAGFGAKPEWGSGSASQPRGDEEGQCDPICQVLSEIAEYVHGDTLVAAWHDNGAAPTHLAWHRKPLDRNIAAEMLTAASRLSHTDQPLSWCVSADRRHRIMVMRYPVQGGVVTVTVLRRESGAPNVSFSSGEALRQHPLLEPFFRLWVQQLRTASRATDLVRAIDKLDVAAFHFDEQGRLLFSNGAGRALIASGNGLHQADTSLCGATLADTIALQSAIDDVTQADSVIAGGRECPVIALSRANQRPLLAAIAAIDPDRFLKGGTAVVVYVIDPDQELQSRLEPVCKLYCLSPVETKLACLLAEGSSLTDAAGLISVREQTARSYLKQIFAKTHTTRQAELVGVLLKSAVLTVTTPALHTQV